MELVNFTYHAKSQRDRSKTLQVSLNSFIQRLHFLMEDAGSVSNTNIDFLEQEKYEEHRSLFIRYFVATIYFVDNNKEKRMN